MTGSWRPTTLGQVACVKHGFAFAGEHFSDGPTRDILLTPGNFSIGGGFKLDRPKFYDGPVPAPFVLRPGSLVVTMTDLSKTADTLGFGALVPESHHHRFLHNQRVGLVELRDGAPATLEFIHWITRSAGYRQTVVSSASGSTVKHTAPSRIESHSFLLPPLPEQRAIARILGALDDKIELNRWTNETLEAMARALFQSWFVDFDPVRAKMEGRQPEGMDAETAKLVMVEELIRTGVLAIGDGYRAKNDELGAEGLCFARAADVVGGEVAETVDHLLPERVALARDKVARQGDVVFTSKGTVGRFALVRGGRPFVYSPQLCFWRSVDTAILPPLYLFQWMQSSEFVEQINMVKGQTDMADYVSLRDQRAMRVRVPDSKLAQRFVSATRPLDTQLDQLRRQSTTLTTLRDALLPKLLSGELRVPDAERLASEVL